MTNVIIPVRDRYRLTKQCLESLEANTSADSYTLTIVDDGSTDFRVQRLLKHYTTRPKTTLIRLENSGHVLSQVKNIGVCCSEQLFSKGEWLYLSDNDVYFKPNWLDCLIAIAVRSKPQRFVLWGGQIHPFHLTHEVEGDDAMRESEVLDGPSWLMEWTTWKEFGPLEGTAPGVCQSEDDQFCRKLRAFALHIGVHSPPVVLHTGLTNSYGLEAPGYDLRVQGMIPGVLYE